MENSIALLRTRLDLLMPELSARNKEYCTDDNLRRLLVSRNMDVEKAVSQLVKTLIWRDEVIPEHMTCQLCAENPRSHDLRQVGLDAEDRPVFYACFSQAQGRASGVWQHLVEKLETVIRVRNAQVGGQPLEQWIWVIDFHGFALQEMMDQPALPASN